MTEAARGELTTAESVQIAAEKFLSQHATAAGPRQASFTWGQGDDTDVAIWEEPDPEQERRQLTRSRAWRALRYDAGLGWLDGPAEFGGGGLAAEMARRYRAVEARYTVPDQSFFKLDRVIGPVLLRYASEAVRAGYLSALFRGDIIACELFSEPEAGSDLAAVRMSAARTDGTWILNGQKVWTSDAHYADVGLALCRTEPESRRHESLTTFLVDMHHPGVEVRPLRQMTGGSSFNEVFLTDVPVPDSHRVGDIGQGWEVVQSTLKIERSAIGLGLGRGGAGLANGRRVVEMARHLELAADPLVRQQIAATYTGFRLAKYLGMVAQADQAAGEDATAAGFLAKLALTRNTRAMVGLVRYMLGQRLAADTGEWGTFAWHSFVLGEPGLHITAGTDEILRTIVGERVLGLPRD